MICAPTTPNAPKSTPSMHLLMSCRLMMAPSDHLPALQKAIQAMATRVHDPTKDKLNPEHDKLLVGLKGSLGDHAVDPRTLSASLVGRLVQVVGIITKASLVRPKVAVSVHYCEATSLFSYKEYFDSTSVSNGIPSNNAYPQEDESGNPLTTEFGYCVFRDHQIVSVQEMPERSPPGQLPRSVDVVLDDDLADSVKPGDRVMVVGVYKCLGSNQANATFRTVIVANSVTLANEKAGLSSAIHFSSQDVRNINKIARKRNVVDLLAASLAPSVFGHDMVKKAVLLMLLGGEEKNLANGTHLRGDINILMIGDPSTAKSQMLRFILNVAPLAIATTGRGSSGVGLTAAVVSDKETGDRRLEAGAMVLADRGVVCIDEFDKMSDIDRVAMHEVMEQQTVTIAKAGIHTTLNARCSVIAAANPVFGQYDEQKKPHQNIALPDSLLSRFDLLFVILDRINDATDRELSSHVLRMHRFVDAKEDSGVLDPIDTNARQEEEEGRGEAPLYEKHAMFQRHGTTRRNQEPLLTTTFIRKYIHYAKNRVRPELTKGATDYIVDAYSDLRNNEQPDNRSKTLPITARTLETLIRLSTAHAKARLSARIEEQDARAAHDILAFSVFKDVVETRRKKKQRRAQNGNDMDVSGDEEEEVEEQVVPTQEEPPPTDQALSDERYFLFCERLDHQRAIGLLDSGSITLVQLMPELNRNLATLFSVDEAEQCLMRMQEENKVMYRNRTIIII